MNGSKIGSRVRLATVRTLLRLYRWARRARGSDSDRYVYDVLNAGPLNRFCTAAAISHNCLFWLTRNTKMLHLLAQGMDLYEAHARMYKGYCDPRPLKKVDPTLRKECKCAFLGLGYRMGPGRYREAAAAATGVTMSLEKAKEDVYSYRDANPAVVGLWNQFDEMIRSDSQLNVQFPSRRTVTYRDVRFNPEIDDRGKPRGWEARFLLGGPHYKVHGGVLVENLVQGVAREVFAHCLKNVERAGLYVIHHAHDELTVEVPDDSVEECKQGLIRAMATPPSWMPGLPLASEVIVAKRYEK